MGNIDSVLDDPPHVESEYYNEKKVFTAAEHRPFTSGNWRSFGQGSSRNSNYMTSNIAPKYATLVSPPLFKSLIFHCPKCDTKCFDGGLCKITSCACGIIYKRNDEDDTLIIHNTPLEQTFISGFYQTNNRTSDVYIPELQSLTLGLFREGIPREYIIGGRSNFQSVFNFYLAPYFKKRSRCVGIGEYFAFKEAKFKVLGCLPSFGVVTESTVIHCSDILTMNTIERVQILPVLPSIINEEVFHRILQPNLRQKPRHLHTGDYLYINNMEFMVTAGQPIDGCVSLETQFFFEGEFLHPIQRVSLIPYLEDISFQYQALRRDQLIEEIICDFIMPWVQGNRRVVHQGQVVTIYGVGFYVLDAWPNRGIIVDNTQIRYDGSMGRRNVNEPPSVMFSGGNLYVRRNQMWEDPQDVLARHIMNLNQSMAVMGAPSVQPASEEMIQRLPTKRLDTIPEDAEAAKCMVCLESYQIGDDAKSLPCCNFYLVHMFHTVCIDEWMRRSCLCPLCKSSIIIVT